jgi:hypothetical protein
MYRFILGDVRCEFMQRLFVVLHGALGSYLCHGLHEGGASIVACLPTLPLRGLTLMCLFSFLNTS